VCRQADLGHSSLLSHGRRRRVATHHDQRRIPGQRSSPVRGPLQRTVTPIAAASSARPGPITLSLTSPRCRSSVGPSSAASSTSTSGPHRRPGQHRWPSSGTHRPGAQPVDQICQRQQAAGRERTPAIRDHHERISGRDVSPPCRQREQHAVLVVEMNTVLVAVLAVRDELEVPTGQRVERVRHPHTPVPVIWMGVVDDAVQRLCRALGAYSPGRGH
jgi:hypothetical protein